MGMAKRQGGRRPRREHSGIATIYGLHAAREALRNPARNIRAVHATQGAAQRLDAEIVPRGLTPRIAEPRELERLAGTGAVHQGIVVEADPLVAPDLATSLAAPGARMLLVLDQLTDPRNVGAILRLAAAFGADGMVVTRHHSPQATGALAKAASGGLEHVPVHEIGNLARALEQIREADFLVIGLDSDGGDDLAAIECGERVALVLGAEGAGLRRLTRAHCDHLARIALPGPIRSVNVSTAAALALQALRFQQSGR